MIKQFPNLLSVTRLGIGLVIVSLLFVPHHIWVAQALIVAGIISDKLDGTLARALGAESELGKKLESIVDPLFSLATGLYVLFYTDIPAYFVLVATSLLLITLCGRGFLLVIGKRFFYQKHPWMRYGTGLGYLLGVLYVFELPLREWFVFPILVYGLIGFAIYMRMLIQAWASDDAASTQPTTPRSQ